MKARSIVAATFVLLMAHAAAAQDWPERAVRFVLPAPPGGNMDIAARIVASRLKETFGQTFLVENKPGSSGLIAGSEVLKAPADGHTLFFSANGPLLFAPTITGRNTYSWKADFIPVAAVNLTPIVLQVTPSLGVKDVKELFDLARAEPGKLAMAAPGLGTSNHLMSEYIQSKHGVKWTTVHYRGNAPATNDVIAGHVQFNFDQVTVALPFIKSKRTRALAVTGDKRMPSMPDVPTFKEAGYPDIHGVTFTGLLAPKGTPAAVVAKLNGAINEVLKEPGVIEQFAKVGAEASPMTPEQFAQFLEKEDSIWLPIIKQHNIRSE